MHAILHSHVTAVFLGVSSCGCTVGSLVNNNWASANDCSRSCSRIDCHTGHGADASVVRRVTVVSACNECSSGCCCGEAHGASCDASSSGGQSTGATRE